MTIEIREPELQAFIQERMATGEFANPEEVLLQALCRTPAWTGLPRQKTLMEVLESGRGLGEGVDFRRDPSPARDVEF